MKKITKKILSVVMVISLLLCSSMALSLGAYAADDVIFTDCYDIEYRGDILYGVPGEEIDYSSVLPDYPVDYVCASSLDYYVVEDVWDEYGGNLIGLNAIDNGVALINVWYVINDEIVDDFYVLVVVSDGSDLGSVSSIDVEDVVMGYDEEVYVTPSVSFDCEGVYYCTFFDCQDYEAPFELWSDGYCYGFDGGSSEAICYVIDAQGDVFVDTFEIEVEEPTLFDIIREYIEMFFDFIMNLFMYI